MATDTETELQPPADLPSPYRTYPSTEAGKEVRTPTPFDVPALYAFDPTKPTIDQTRLAAIDAIRANFVALTPAATADLSAFLPKTGGIATDLIIRNSGQVGPIVDAISGGFPNYKLSVSGLLKFSLNTNAAGTVFRLHTYDDAGVLAGVVMNAKRDLTGVQFVVPISVASAGYPRTLSGVPINLDVYGTATQVAVVQNTASGVGLRFIAHSAGAVYLDCAMMNAAGADVATAGGPLNVRTVDSAGVIQQRLGILPTGEIKAEPGQAAFVGGFQFASGGGTLDFRRNQAYAVAAGGSVVISMPAGAVGRILVYGGAGGITLAPSAGGALHHPQSGLLWGAAFTLVSLYCWDGANILTSFTPYDA